MAWEVEEKTKSLSKAVTQLHNLESDNIRCAVVLECCNGGGGSDGVRGGGGDESDGDNEDAGGRGGGGMVWGLRRRPKTSPRL